MDNKILQSRLRSCLQTIIELEPCIAEADAGGKMLDEFKTLKAFLDELDKLSLTEEDVERVEKSTNVFLEELSLPAVRTGKCTIDTESKKLH